MKNKKRKREEILIIKTGYSEVLDGGDGLQKVSYGDVLRTTLLLNLYKHDNVTWVTDEQAYPLLEENQYILQLLPFNVETVMELLDKEFDTLINLEKNHEICKLSNRINAWKKYGFRYDKETNTVQAYDRASEVLAVSSEYDIKRKNEKTVQELLYHMVGVEWKGEEYILGYKPKTQKKFDIGFNIYVGGKWPVKAWPIEYWNELEKKLSNEFTITRQDKQKKEVLKNLYNYMDWINSNDLIITGDSLGLHLSFALKKKVLGLFGPTPYKEVYFYEMGKPILPNSIPDCMPCFKHVCERGRSCIKDITVESVYKEARNILKK